jgi:hypothetical protein
MGLERLIWRFVAAYTGESEHLRGRYPRDLIRELFFVQMDPKADQCPPISLRSSTRFGSLGTHIFAFSNPFSVGLSFSNFYTLLSSDQNEVCSLYLWTRP